MDEMDFEEMEEDIEADKSLEKPRLKTVSGMLETGGRAILIAYGLGFFVVSYFDAKYGVTYLNPLRSRVAFTGIALVLQVAVIVLVFSGEALWRISSTYWESYVIEPEGGNSNFYRWPFFICWIIECAFLGLILRLILTYRAFFVGRLFSAYWNLLPPIGHGTGRARAVDALGPQAAFHHPVVSVLSLAVILNIPFFMKRFPAGVETLKLRNGVAVLALIFGPLFIWAELSEQDYLAYSFVAYVVMVRLVLTLVLAYTRKKAPGMQNRGSGQRLAIASISMAIPILYSECIYPNVMPQWGGAPQVRLWMRFQHNIVPFGCTSNAYLLEETEEGYYLLRPTSDPDFSQAISVNRNTQASESAPECENITPSKDQDIAGDDVRPDPSSYYAVYVPRREVTQVNYRQSHPPAQ